MDVCLRMLKRCFDALEVLVVVGFDEERLSSQRFLHHLCQYHHILHSRNKVLLLYEHDQSCYDYVQVIVCTPLTPDMD